MIIEKILIEQKLKKNLMLKYNIEDEKGMLQQIIKNKN
jgi:hypothetical protein